MNYFRKQFRTRGTVPFRIGQWGTALSIWACELCLSNGTREYHKLLCNLRGIVDYRKSMNTLGGTTLFVYDNIMLFKFTHGFWKICIEKDLGTTVLKIKNVFNHGSKT